MSKFNYAWEQLCSVCDQFVGSQYGDRSTGTHRCGATTSENADTLNKALNAQRAFDAIECGPEGDECDGCKPIHRCENHDYYMTGESR